jgi:hypothetical protein
MKNVLALLVPAALLVATPSVTELRGTQNSPPFR